MLSDGCQRNRTRQAGWITSGYRLFKHICSQSPSDARFPGGKHDSRHDIGGANLCYANNDSPDLAGVVERA